MELRDEFAMNADISDFKFPDMDSTAKWFRIDPPFDDSDREQIMFVIRLTAALRYAIADAMIAERNKRQE